MGCLGSTPSEEGGEEKERSGSREPSKEPEVALELEVLNAVPFAKQSEAPRPSDGELASKQSGSEQPQKESSEAKEVRNPESKNVEHKVKETPSGAESTPGGVELTPGDPTNVGPTRSSRLSFQTARSSDISESARPPMRILLSYDFDKTISKIHICKKTRGKKLTEEVKAKLLENFQTDQCWMGPLERTDRLRKHFKTMYELGCLLVVNSFGNPCVNRWVLEHFDMAQYFEEVNQSVKHGLHPPSKAHYLRKLQLKHSVLVERTLHIDDDAGVTAHLRKNRVSHTLHVKSRTGLKELHTNQVEVEVRNWLEFGDCMPSHKRPQPAKESIQLAQDSVIFTEEPSIAMEEPKEASLGPATNSPAVTKQASMQESIQNANPSPLEPVLAVAESMVSLSEPMLVLIPSSLELSRNSTLPLE